MCGVIACVPCDGLLTCLQCTPCLHPKMSWREPPAGPMTPLATRWMKWWLDGLMSLLKVDGSHDFNIHMMPCCFNHSSTHTLIGALSHKAHTNSSRHIHFLILSCASFAFIVTQSHNHILTQPYTKKSLIPVTAYSHTTVSHDPLSTETKFAESRRTITKGLKGRD